VKFAASGEVNMKLTVPICSVPGSPLDALPADQPKVCFLVLQKFVDDKQFFYLCGYKFSLCSNVHIITIIILLSLFI